MPKSYFNSPAVLLEKHRCCDVFPLKPAARLLFRQPPDAAVPQKHLKAAKLPRTHRENCLDQHNPIMVIRNHPESFPIETHLGQGSRIIIQ